MKQKFKDILNIKDEIWLFLYPIIAFYMIGVSSDKTIVINDMTSLISFTVKWLFCSIGICVIIRIIAELILYIIKTIKDLLDKKRD